MKFCPECGNKLYTKVIDGASRQVCENSDCSFVYWNNPIPVVAALVQYKDKYILARNTAWPKGVFSGITGYLEQGESPEQAVVREVKEELNLEGKVTRFLGHFNFKEKNQLIIAFEVHATGELHTNHELAEIKHLTSDELLKYDFRPLYITQGIIKAWSK